MRPGIYCKDEATYDELRLASIGKGVLVQYQFDGDVSIGGMRVYVATPEQAEVLDRSGPVDPMRYEDDQRVLANLAHNEFARLMGRLTSMISATPKPARRTEPPVPGANRAQRRADAAKKRRLA